MTFTLPKGTYDLLPQEPNAEEQWRNIHLWHQIEGVIRELAPLYGFHEIRTPLFERIEIFQRGIGESSDIVSKEMYAFEDKAGRMMVLRPEGTSSVIRAFIEKQLGQQAYLHKLYYIGPMFRYERPQAGRYRQHMQFGAEIIGNKGAEQDAEAIDFLYTFYQKLGLKNLTLHLNSVGDASCRAAFRKALLDYLAPHVKELSEDSQKRYENNPLRILDSKDKKDQALLQGAPSILDYLNEECRTHFDTLCALLKTLSIPFCIAPKLVRGLDYYTNTVFEITAGELGAQNSIGAGGRYDGLLKTLGGPNLPAVGFAAGLERVLQTMIAQKVPLATKKGPDIFFIPLGDEAMRQCFLFTKKLRSRGVATEMDYSKKKLPDLLRYASQIGAVHVAVIGENELASKTVELKEMATRETRKMSLSELVEKYV